MGLQCAEIKRALRCYREQVKLSDYAGYTVVIDASGWLYKAVRRAPLG
jgi:hypothetical protein